MNLSFLQKKVEFRQTAFDLTAFFLFFVVAGCLFYATLFRWGDLIIDTFRDFYLPSAILDGRILYRDIYYDYGFFAPYFIAGWFKLFGISILSLALCGFTVLLTTVMALYKAVSLFTNKFLACFIVLMFLLVFAFGRYIAIGIFNFILPYSFASTFFAAFFAGAIYFFLKFVLSEKPGYLFAWGYFLTLAFTARPETSLLVWFGFFLSFLVYCRVTRKPFFTIKIVCMPVIAATLCYFTFFIFIRSFSEFKSYFLGLLAKALGGPFAIQAMGFSDFGSNLAHIGVSLLWNMILLSLAAAGAFFSGLALRSFDGAGSRRKKDCLRFIPVLVIALSFTLAAIYFLNRFFNFFFQYNALPVILIAGIIFSLTRLRFCADRREYAAMAILCLISLFPLARVFIRVTPGFYNFFLIIPGVAAYYILFYRIGTDFFERHLRYFFNPAYIVTLSLVFIFQALLFWRVSYAHYQASDFAMKTDKGTFITHRDTYTFSYWLTVDYLLQNTRPSDTVLVVPEGIGINFFTNRRNPTPYMYLLPYLFRVFDEDKVIGDLAKAKANYIVFTARDTDGYGANFFGVDYAQKLYAWILGNYALVQQFGHYPFTSPRFGIAIFKRKDK